MDQRRHVAGLETAQQDPRAETRGVREQPWCRRQLPRLDLALRADHGHAARRDLRGEEGAAAAATRCPPSAGRRARAPPERRCWRSPQPAGDRIEEREAELLRVGGSARRVVRVGCERTGLRQKAREQGCVASELRAQALGRDRLGERAQRLRPRPVGRRALALAAASPARRRPPPPESASRRAETLPIRRRRPRPARRAHGAGRIGERRVERDAARRHARRTARVEGADAAARAADTSSVWGRDSIASKAAEDVPRARPRVALEQADDPHRPSRQPTARTSPRRERRHGRRPEQSVHGGRGERMLRMQAVEQHQQLARGGGRRHGVPSYASRRDIPRDRPRRRLLLPRRGRCRDRGPCRHRMERSGFGRRTSTPRRSIGVNGVHRASLRQSIASSGTGSAAEGAGLDALLEVASDHGTALRDLAQHAAADRARDVHPGALRVRADAARPAAESDRALQLALEGASLVVERGGPCRVAGGACRGRLGADVARPLPVAAAPRRRAPRPRRRCARRRRADGRSRSSAWTSRPGPRASRTDRVISALRALQPGDLGTARQRSRSRPSRAAAGRCRGAPSGSPGAAADEAVASSAARSVHAPLGVAGALRRASASASAARTREVESSTDRRAAGATASSRRGHRLVRVAARQCQKAEEAEIGPSTTVVSPVTRMRSAMRQQARAAPARAPRRSSARRPRRARRAPAASLASYGILAEPSRARSSSSSRAPVRSPVSARSGREAARQIGSVGVPRVGDHSAPPPGVPARGARGSICTA